ncbi:carbonic anhydrase [Hydrogenovibrio thermophilus]|uniref:carbonic anhydrase n=1 Tax=Hydrogenovibrio thermophilus TaxID=265883 RepID=A0A410H428_9GAMM|nr:carbonic anhydrase family protein [Hydrogenovibrio thermophilus]QAB15674.1 carbonic anhydrase family protein [Hydrogenovibrio thermophilus]
MNTRSSFLMLLGCLVCLPLYAADSNVPPLIDLGAEAKKQAEKQKKIAVSQPKSAETSQPKAQADDADKAKVAAKPEAAKPAPEPAETKPVAWSYFGDDGPQNWGQLSTAYATCKAGKNQSPINFKRDDAVGTTSLNGFDVYYRKSILKMINDGHVLKVEVPLGSYIMLNGQRYELMEYEFHTPSEHQIDGFSYPMEMQLVHKDGNGDYAVVSILFQEGAENEALAAFLDRLPKQLNKLDVHDKVLVHPAKAFFPVDKRFYKYSGSMTQPPCDEGVYWMVFKQPVEASAAQLQQMKEYLGTNARPVQPLNARTPLKSWPDRQAQESFYLY